MPLSLEQCETLIGASGETDQVTGKSTVIKPLSFARPWYRAFHFSWLSFFLAFTGWFAFAPVLTTILEDPDLNITRSDVDTSNILSVVGTIFLRLSIGPVLEKYGPRRVQTLVLFIGGALVLISASVSTGSGLMAIRFFIGGVGVAFVPCQFWTTMMFSSEIVGAANAIVGGWGNLGGGVANLLMAALLEGFGPNGLGYSEYEAWRIAMIIPGLLMISVCIPMWFYSDDCPYGEWSNRAGKQKLLTTEKSEEEEEQQTEPYKIAFSDWRVWAMAFQYGCCFGVELTINATMATYLYEHFVNDDPTCIENPETPALDCSALTKSQAGAVASLFGLMNLFARAIGGFVSDYLYGKYGMQGRLSALAFFLVGEGIFLLIFSRITDIAGAIAMLILFSIFVQSSEGATYGIVPFVNRNAVGIVAGVVGAGGNIGSAIWLTIIKQVGYQTGYFILGWIVLVSSLVTALYSIEGIYLFSFGKYNKTVEEEEAVVEELEEEFNIDNDSIGDNNNNKITSI